MGIFDKKGIFETIKDVVGLSEEARQLRKVARLERQVADEPRNLEAWEQLRQCYEFLGKTDEHARCCLKIGNIYFAMQSYDIALTYYEIAESLFQFVNIPLLKQKTLAYLNCQRLDDAYRTARTVIEEYVRQDERSAALEFLRLLPSFGPFNTRWKRELGDLIPGREGKTGSLLRTSWRSIPKFVPALHSTPEEPLGELIVVEPNTQLTVSNFYSKLFDVGAQDESSVGKASDESAVQPLEAPVMTKLSGFRVLLIARDDNFKYKLSNLLTGLGATLLYAPSADTAKGFFSYELPSLVLVQMIPGDWQWYQIYTFVLGHCETEDIPVVCVSEFRDDTQFAQALDAGVADCWAWPLSPTEFASRVLKVYHASFDERGAITGSLAEISLPDLLQMLEGCRKTGVLVLKKGSSDFGSIYFSDGRAIDAKYKRWEGENAFYRLLKWVDGSFRFSPQLEVDRPENIRDTVQGMLMEAMKRLDEQEKLLPSLPPGNLVLCLRPFNSKTINLNPAYPRLMALFDGQRTMASCVEELDMDTEALELIISLYSRGLLCTAEELAHPLPELPTADDDDMS